MELALATDEWPADLRDWSVPGDAFKRSVISSRTLTDRYAVACFDRHFVPGVRGTNYL